MKPIYVICGNEEFFDQYEDEIKELEEYARSKKVIIAERSRKDGVRELGFFSANPIKQFQIGFKVGETGMMKKVGYTITPSVTISDKAIDKALDKIGL